jgi:Zn-dependent M32 family carboxypeptidase
MSLYDAAIDDFDPRMRTERLTEIFDQVTHKGV